MLLNLYFAWWVGSSLEQHWGAFKFNAFYFMGVVGTVVAAFLTGPQTNFWLDASLFLAFATTFPEVQILLFFILPIRVKWLGIVAGAGDRRRAAPRRLDDARAIAGGDGQLPALLRRSLAAGLAVDETSRSARRRAARSSTAGSPSSGSACARSAAQREADGADIRVCSCEKCGGQQRALCLEHARNH